MGGFVHEQAAAIGFFTMPTPEIIRAVAGIQQPTEIDQQRTPDYTSLQQLSEARIGGRITIIEGNPQRFATAPQRCEDSLQAVQRGGQRFFADDITAGFQRRDNVMMMPGINCSHDDGVGLPIRQHTREVVGMISRHSGRQLRAVPVHARLTEVTERDQLRLLRILADDSVDEHTRARTRADDGIFFSIARHDYPPSLLATTGIRYKRKR